MILVREGDLKCQSNGEEEPGKQRADDAAFLLMIVPRGSKNKKGTDVPFLLA